MFLFFCVARDAAHAVADPFHFYPLYEYSYACSTGNIRTFLHV